MLAKPLTNYSCLHILKQNITFNTKGLYTTLMILAIPDTILQLHVLHTYLGKQSEQESSKELYIY